MKRHSAALCATALLALLAGCATPPPAVNTGAEIQAIKDNEVQWNKDWDAKDAAKLVAHYTDDAVLMVPAMPALQGAAAIQKALTEMVADPALSLKFQAGRVELAKSGDLAYTQGTYTLTVTDPATKKPITDKGSYVTVYKKQADGSWKAVQDAAVSEIPPPAPEPAKKKK